MAHGRDFRAERAKASTWILTLVHRRAVDLVRREERRRAEPLQADAASGGAGPAGSAEDAAWLGFERERVQAALRTLPDAQREAIELAYYGGFSQSELAERLGQPLGTIKSRMFAGLARLREAAGRRRIRGIMDAEAHELMAGYALDALDEAERGAREEHLATCEAAARSSRRSRRWPRRSRRCGGPDPARPELRERILEARPRRAARTSSRWRRGGARALVPVLGAVAAVAACAALAVGLWGASVSSDLDDARDALERERAAAAVLAEPDVGVVAHGQRRAGSSSARTGGQCSCCRARRRRRPARRTRCG